MVIPIYCHHTLDNSLTVLEQLKQAELIGSVNLDGEITKYFHKILNILV